MRTSRDWIWLEVLALLSVLVAGAGLRYWLSTAIPLDASEFAALSRASVRDHGMRVPFIMCNGASLFALYLLVRRAAGIEAAFAVRVRRSRSTRCASVCGQRRSCPSWSA